MYLIITGFCNPLCFTFQFNSESRHLKNATVLAHIIINIYIFTKCYLLYLLNAYLRADLYWRYKAEHLMRHRPPLNNLHQFVWCSYSYNLSKLFEIKLYMASDWKTAPIRTMFNTVRPWVKICGCIRFHQNISKIITCKLNARKQDRRTHRRTNVQTTFHSLT